MALLIPETPKECNVSERLIFERLGRELPDDWVVLHSLGLPGHKTKIWGEADIVILSTSGVFALEVKGSAAITCSAGVWHFTGPGDRRYSKKEDPWTQAKGTLMAVRDALWKADTAFRDVLFGFGVVMPITTFTETGIEIVPEVLLDKREIRQTLDHYINDLKKYWQGSSVTKTGKSCRGLTPAEIRRIRQLLRPDLETALSLGSYLSAVTASLVALTNEQIRTSRRLAANPRTITRGAAGTGKSVLALERARQLSAEGRRVLFVCFNVLLARHIQEANSADPRAAGLHVQSVHSLYRDLIRRAGLLDRFNRLDDGDPAFFTDRFPELAIEALLTLDEPGWDVLVIDEAQDVLTPQHLDVFDLLVHGGLRQGRWHLFFDPLQNLYGADIEKQVEHRLRDSYPAFDDLTENCRNTRQIAVQASIISGLDVALAGAPDGPHSQMHYYASDAQGLAALEALIHALIEADVPPGDIAILSTRRLDNSLLAGGSQLAGRRLVDFEQLAALRTGALLFSTMHGFKGLERPVVIALDMGEIGHERHSMLHYAGLTRAQGLLHILAPDAARSAYERQSQAFGRRLQKPAA